MPRQKQPHLTVAHGCSGSQATVLIHALLSYVSDSRGACVAETPDRAPHMLAIADSPRPIVMANGCKISERQSTLTEQTAAERKLIWQIYWLNLRKTLRGHTRPLSTIRGLETFSPLAPLSPSTQIAKPRCDCSNGHIDARVAGRANLDYLICGCCGVILRRPRTRDFVVSDTGAGARRLNQLATNHDKHYS